ncbi:MAG: PilW family protein [Acidimicrobiia bacterium]
MRDHATADAHGFTLLELLIAVGISLSIGGAIAVLTPRARAAFERVPAEMEIQQRGLMALDSIAATVRAAGKNVVAAQGLGVLADLFPALVLADADESGTVHHSLTAIVPIADPAQGVLASNQVSAASPMALATTGCPNVREVCGFTNGAAALIVDAGGHVEVFLVASANAAARQLTPNRPLSRAYPAGSVVVEVDQHTFRLDAQADGSYSLIRVTAAGAVQPIVDFLSSLSFSLSHGQLEVSLSVQSPPGILQRHVSGGLFKTSIRLRNAP